MEIKGFIVYFALKILVWTKIKATEWLYALGKFE